MNDYVIRVNSSNFEIKIISENELNFDSEKINYELIQLDRQSYLLCINNKVYKLIAEKIENDSFKVLGNGKYYEVTVHTSLQERAVKLLNTASTQSSQQTVIKAPMPGLILKFKKNVGDIVEKGESIIILEAMKMENEIKSPSKGILKEIFVSDGSAVEKGSALFCID